eukprot:1155939-Pelagomonas_calceolata.AAC.2
MSVHENYGYDTYGTGAVPCKFRAWCCMKRAKRLCSSMLGHIQPHLAKQAACNNQAAVRVHIETWGPQPSIFVQIYMI